jgi:1,4-dihydroxy-2-naphthoate octaprenyltransferase
MLAIPLFFRNALAIRRKPSASLDPYLKQMAISTLLFVLLFGLGLIIH